VPERLQGGARGTGVVIFRVFRIRNFRADDTDRIAGVHSRGQTRWSHDSGHGTVSCRHISVVGHGVGLHVRSDGRRSVAACRMRHELRKQNENIL
jgi:hypothetical protein